MMNLDLGPDRNNSNVKESAYLLNAMDTLKKLEREFKEDIGDNLLFQPNSMFKRIRTLLNSYQVMVLQINDSFEFMEVPEFGCCILKVFLQMMSIIKWVLKSIVARPATSKNVSLNQQPVLKKSDFSIKMDEKQLSEGQKYKLKEQSKYMMKGLDYDMQKYQKTNQNDFNSSAALNTLLSDKQKILKIQASHSQNILEEAVKNLSKKGQNILQFIQMRQNYMNYCKINAGNYTTDGFDKMKQVIQKQSADRTIKVKDKIRLLLSNCIKVHDQQRRQSMVSKCYQAHVKDSNTQTRQQIKLIERLKGSVLQLQQQLNYEKQVNQGLTQLLQKTNNDHESQLMKQRIEKIKLFKKSSKQEQPKRSAQNPKKIAIAQGIYEQVQLDKKQKRSLIFKKSSKRLTSRRRIEEFQDNDEQGDSTQYQEFQQLNEYKIGNRALKSFRSQNHGLRFLKFDSRTATYDYYPVHQKFKQSTAGMLTTIDFGLLIKTKGCQTQRIRVFQIETVINQLFQGFKERFRHDKSQIVNDTQSLIRFNKPKSHRQSAIKRIAQNLSARSSRMPQFMQLQRQLCGLSNNQTATSTRPKTPVVKSKFVTQSQNKIVKVSDLILSKIKVTCQLKNSLLFDKSDLLNLFLTEQNAKNYEYLNFNFKPQKPQKPKSPSSKSAKLGSRWQVNFSEDDVNSQVTLMRQKSRLHHQNINRMVSFFIKQVRKYLKQNRKLNVAIRSFIRYPYSSIRKSKQQEWIQYQNQQDQLQSWQLKRYFYRILQLHSKCFDKEDQVVCKHIKKFYQKIGITIL